MVDPLVVAAAVGLAGSVAPLAPVPGLVVALVWSLAAIILRRSVPGLSLRKKWACGAVLALIFLACGSRTTGRLHSFEKSYFGARMLLSSPARCAGTAVVTASPVRRASMDSKELVTIWTGKSEDLDCEGTVFPQPVTLRLYGGPSDLSRGDRVDFVAQLGSVRMFRNASLPSPWPGVAKRRALFSGSALFADRVSKGAGLFHSVDRKRAQVRERIMRTYSAASAPLGRALVLGESDLDASDADAFRQSGLLHLLAVSGTHLVIAVLALVQALGALLVRVGPLSRRYDVRRISSAAGAGMSLLYADFSGGSGSAWRAAFMLCVVCGGRALGLKVNGSAALGASILIGLAIEPLLGFDYSFLLSALATAGLIGLGQPLSRGLDAVVRLPTPLRLLALSFIATIASTLPCAPVLAFMDGDMTWASLFANVIAGPMGELVALPACLLHAISSSFPPLERGLALVGSGALHWVRGVALWSASVDVAQFPVPMPSVWSVTGLLVSLLLLPVFEWTKRSFAVLFAFMAILGTAALAFGKADPEAESGQRQLAITALDVGQGDALMIDFPDGQVGLMDGGGFVTEIPDTGERVVLPALRSRGRDHLGVVMLSHPHPDHMLGLLSVARELPIRELWVPRLPTEKEGHFSELVGLARASGARILTARALCGTRTFGGTTIDVLAPCGKGNEHFGANDASLVLRIRHGGRAALLTGDVEKEGEAALLLKDAGALRADLLKVAHHGSDTSSTPALVDAVSPSYAFISSGLRNRFNHPRPKTLRTLEDRGISVYRTDQLGSLTWRTDGRKQWISTSDSAILNTWRLLKTKPQRASTPATPQR